MNIYDMKAPYLTDGMIEYQAKALLKEFEAIMGSIDEAPVPIEDIIENHLNIRLEVDDFTRHEYFGEDGYDVLGYIDIKNKAIYINQNIDPMENDEANEGRFYFTLAHETGHFVLHQGLFEEFYSQIDMFDDAEEQPAILCRTPEIETNMRPFVEQQADKFAAALLMPQKLLIAEWKKIFGDDKPRTHDELSEHYPEEMNDDGLPALHFLAERFKVSFTAMRIRLESVGLMADGKQDVLL